MQDLYHQPHVRLRPKGLGSSEFRGFLVSIAASCCRPALPHLQGRHSAAATVAAEPGSMTGMVCLGESIKVSMLISSRPLYSLCKDS